MVVWGTSEVGPGPGRGTSSGEGVGTRGEGRVWPPHGARGEDGGPDDPLLCGRLRMRGPDRHPETRMPAPGGWQMEHLEALLPDLVPFENRVLTPLQGSQPAGMIPTPPQTTASAWAYLTPDPVGSPCTCFLMSKTK